mgnify:CR=1 FL=1
MSSYWLQTWNRLAFHIGGMYIRLKLNIVVQQVYPASKILRSTSIVCWVLVSAVSES